MTLKVLPLEGYKALKAYNAFNALLLGLKMLPVYNHLSYEEFFASFADMTDDERERKLRQAVDFVGLAEDEIAALVSFVPDRNGIPYDATNSKRMPVADMHQAIVAVCMAIGRIKADLLTEAEKKSYRNSASTSSGLGGETPVSASPT